jgi:hypothetical protein
MKDGRPTVAEMLAKEFSNLKNKKKWKILMMC